MPTGETSELERTKRSLAAVQAIAAAGTERDISRLVKELLRIVTEATESDAGCIYLLGEDGCELAGHTGINADMAEKYAQISLHGPITGDAVARREAVALRAADLPEGRREDTLREGLAVLAVAPLHFLGRVVGLITLARRDDRPYSAQELATAGLLADQLAIQIEGARQREDERRRVLDLSLINELGALISRHLELDELLSAGVRQAARLVGVSNVFLLLVDPDGEHMRVVASTVDDPDVMGAVLRTDAHSAPAHALRTREPFIADDPASDPRTDHALALRFGHRALLSVPLVARGEAIGAVCLGVTREPKRIRRVDVDSAVAVANQLAGAIVNARLYADARRRVEELGVLLEVGRAVTALLDLEAILETSAGALTRLVDASSAFILLIDKTRGELTGAATSNAEQRAHFRRVRIKLDQPSVAARCVREGRPIAVSDAASASDVDRRLVAKFGEKSLLALPLFVRGEPIGALVIDDVRRIRTWTDAEIERATLISQQVGVAIANARLFDDLKASYAELRRTQAELVKRERLAALGELAAVIAHEVRNPLGVIFNSLGSLNKILKPEGDAATLLAILQEEADRLNALVSDLLDFARPMATSIQAESLEGVILRAVAAARSSPAARGVMTSIEVEPGLPPVPIDERLMRGALVNLVLNGVQAMPQGGTLRIRAGLERSGDRSFARLDVVDAGHGIPEEVRAQIFQPFFTTKASGTGLGLAVVKRIVEAHHGDITFTSSEDGTTFTIRLPLDDHARPGSDRPTPTPMSAPLPVLRQV